MCCIVFDIDGMLFEFFMNFLNIEKKIKNFLFSFMFSSLFMLFPTFLETKFLGGGQKNCRPSVRLSVTCCQTIFF